ncbi:HlyD family secretion protein [Flagellimonas sp.]|jgi:HlyD family secretion protein|uniref:HlyD family secretion protein n=1 Tax=Flagellimonas sp. TaxID=2058762 RepID=UPI000B72227B|nr:MAG: HlyD family efflux transporter periplasmic adaptor subunit [Muricauda sp. TMED12]|tara:strand:- start:1491 stop:2411 length:921 start_codon:yes stop_codon:yes gene_type:complete
MKRAATKVLMTKKALTILSISMLAISLTSCNGRGDLADGYGNFEATETTVSAEANGKIQFLDVSEGNLLEKNEVVGIIDTIQLALKRDQLKAVKQTIYSKSTNVLSQRDVLQEELQVAQNDKKRIENMIKENAATQKQWDDIQGKVRILQQQIKSVETQNAPIINEVKGIEVQIEQIEDQIEKSIVKSPLQGTVLVKYAEPGEVAVFGKPLFKMANLDEMELRVYISETQLPNIKIGQQVTVKIDDVDSMRSYEGRVSWISASAEFTPKIIQTKEERVNLVYAVKIKVKNDGSLKIGMPAEMWIVN